MTDEVNAYVLVKTDVGKADLVLSDIQNIPQVSKATLVTGEYDIVVELVSSSVEDILTTVAKAIHGISNITKTNTLVGARLSKSMDARVNL